MIGRFKLAIERKDWALIEKVYNDLLSFLSDGAVSTQTTPSAPSPPKREPAPQRTKPTVSNDFRVEGQKSLAKTVTKPVQNSRRPNLFTPESTPVEKLQGEELINDNVAPTPRTRKPPEMKCVSCNKCGLTFEKPASLVRYDDNGNYLCEYERTKYKCPNLSQN